MRETAASTASTRILGSRRLHSGARRAGLALSLLLLAACALASAETVVEVLDTYPPGSAPAIKTDQSFYLRLRYRSDRAQHYWAQPLFRGQPVRAGTNPSRVYPAGDGEALAWFFLFPPGGEVDEVRISAGSGRLDDTPTVASYRLALTAGRETAAAGAEPEWLGRLRAVDEAASRAAREAAANEPWSLTDMLLVQGFLLLVPLSLLLGFVWPLFALRRWDGLWRLGAIVALLPPAFVLLRLLFGLSRDPGSHNLWPFEVLIFAGPSAVLMILLWLLRRRWSPDG